MSSPAPSANDATVVYEPADVRPVVATGSGGNMGLWAFLVVLAAAGGVLFSALNASREEARAPSVLEPDSGDAVRITSPPPLDIPDRFSGETASDRLLAERLAQAGEGQRDSGGGRSPQPQFLPASRPAQPPLPAASLPPVQVEAQTARVVFDDRSSPPPPLVPAGRGEDGSVRVTAERFLNPSLTIPQGTVIQAVLETALDSTWPGSVRALVQRDVYGFDGSRVLIPRGSRLYGQQFGPDLKIGQNRAMVQWTRLMRPDGVTINLDSPSSDPLGRAGIRGKVDSKFLQRFGGAIVQSILDIGVGIAVNRATDGVIVALPGSTQNVQVTNPQSVQPTLKIRHGTSISVFVARDLDFSTVEP